MMKKIVLFCLAALTLGAFAQDLKLVPPQTNGGAALREALAKRCSIRKYSGKALTPQQLSNLFYAASGMNRKDARKLTIPTARNVQDLILFAATAQGIYRFDPAAHTLKLLKKGDYRAQFGIQRSMFAKAAVVLIVVSDFNKLDFAKEENDKNRYAGIHAGFVMQNVGLFCAAEGLGNVIVGMYDRKNAPKLLDLKKNEQIMMTQIVGVLD